MKQYPSSKTFSPSENRSGAVSELYDLAHPQAVLQCAVLGCFFGEGAESLRDSDGTNYSLVTRCRLLQLKKKS